MDNLKTYLNFFKRSYKKDYITYAITVTIISLILVGFTIWTSKVSLAPEMSFAYSISGLNLIFLFVMGILWGSKDFAGAMTIRSDRKSYFKAMIIFSIISILIMYVLDMFVVLTSNIAITTFADNVKINSINILNLSNSFNLEGNVINNLIKNINGLQIFILSIIKSFMIMLFGVFLGAFAYRLRKATAVIIYIGMPTLSVALLAKIAIVLNDSTLVKINNLISSIASNFYALSLFYIIMSIVFIGLSYLCLRKAPIGEYAHDWL